MTVPEHSTIDASAAKNRVDEKSSAPTLNKDDFIKCVDKGLGVFASDEYRAVYWRKYLISKIGPENATENDIVRDPEGFLKAIEDTFDLGAWAIERAITKELRIRFDLEPSESRGLVSAIRTIPNKFPESGQVAVEVSLRKSPKRSLLSPLKSFAFLAGSGTELQCLSGPS